MAGAGRAWAHGRALQVVRRAGTGRSGRTELVGARQAERAAGWASGSRRARQGQAGARGAAGWAASAHLGVLNWARLGFYAP